jgi:hypothetical protein
MDARISTKEAITLALCEIIDAPDGKKGLIADCLDLALNLRLNGNGNQSDIAKKHGVTRACVSRYCVVMRKVWESRGFFTEDQS